MIAKVNMFYFAVAVAAFSLINLFIHELLAAKLITLDEFSHKTFFNHSLFAYPLAPSEETSPLLFSVLNFFHLKKLFH